PSTVFEVKLINPSPTILASAFWQGSKDKRGVFVTYVDDLIKSISKTRKNNNQKVTCSLIAS
ncbi:hypothetical protein P5673_005445, partial [Acropora cervicornis]